MNKKRKGNPRIYEDGCEYSKISHNYVVSMNCGLPKPWWTKWKDNHHHVFLRDLRNNLHGIDRAFGQDPIYTSFHQRYVWNCRKKTSRYPFESKRAVASKSESVAYCRLVSLFAPSVDTIISYYTCYIYIIIYYLCIAFVHCPRLYNNQPLYLSQMLHGTNILFT